MYVKTFSLDETKHGPLLKEFEDTNWTGAEIKACCRLAALLDVPLANAAQNVVPVATTAADKVTALREWASGRCLSATQPGIYNHANGTPPKGRRAIHRKELVHG